MNYRRDIDGLRALAIIPVILFHAGIKQFQGGFVGVDIFFVISGFLITKIISENIEENRFSLIDFYERRARRILPALYLVIFTTLPFAWLWMQPSRMDDFGKSIASTVLFFSNILFWKQTDYFRATVEEKPLLHTWSLSVEEQFYALFPITFLLARKAFKSKIIYVITLFAIASLILSEIALRRNPTANFYLLPTRAWELLLGAICAEWIRKKPTTPSNTLSIIGILAILFSIFYFNQSTPFPSTFALIPTTGTALIILFSGSGTLSEKLLGSKPAVGIGLISYSAYLWHQPIFSLAKIRLTYAPSSLTIATLIFISFSLAYFSWRYIEKPLRKNIPIKILAIASILLLSVASVIFKTAGHVNPFHSEPPNLEWISFGHKHQNTSDICIEASLTEDQEIWSQQCTFGDPAGKKTVVLYGDSHSEALIPKLNESLKNQNSKGIWVHIKDCEPIPYIRRDHSKEFADCKVRFEKFLSFIKSKNADVVVSNRWTFRMYPINGLNIEMPYRNSEGFIEQEDYREYDVIKDGKFYRDEKSKSDALNTFISKLSEASRKLFLVYPVPETAINIYDINWRAWNSSHEILSDISIPYQDYVQRNKFVIDIFKSHNEKNIFHIEPEKFLCNTFIKNRCTMQKDGLPFYVDDDHLGNNGAEFLVNEISKNSN